MRMKKFIAVLSMVSMLAVAATGCGSDKKAEGDSADAGTDTKTEQNDASWDSSNDITIVSREDGSGTRGAFIELFGIEEKNGDEKIDSGMVQQDGEVLQLNVRGLIHNKVLLREICNT